MATSIAELAKSLTLFGPTVDDDVRRLIQRYGAEKVKEATRRLTAQKRGRKKLPDMSELQPFIEQDARIWLEGGDPFAERSNYAIAKELADAKPGHDHASTMQRLERKLGRGRYTRRWYMLVTAMQSSQADYPYERHLAAIRALMELDPDGPWNLGLEMAEGKVTDYRRLIGEPDPSMTMEQITEKAAPLNALAAFTRSSRKGLFGRAD